ncbi:hypothetical protein ACFQ0B_17925 [Nonomuraea thailandensis]
MGERRLADRRPPSDHDRDPPALPFYYFVPQQLTAYTRHPALIMAAYTCFAAGFVLLWPAVMTLAQRICATSPLWGLWGGCLVMVGLFTRTFQFGTDYLAFHLTDSFGLQTMLSGIDDYYQARLESSWHPFKAMSGRPSSAGSCWPSAPTAPAPSASAARSRSA